MSTECQSGSSMSRTHNLQPCEEVFTPRGGSVPALCKEGERLQTASGTAGGPFMGISSACVGIGVVVLDLLRYSKKLIPITAQMITNEALIPIAWATSPLWAPGGEMVELL